ncbi:MAG: hypothetical protein EA398_03390 [Deltaproteobacteria bacterium]|nr:MAG: hypothetical protein EA398_03390 [Deltaproteobacteria bacterium]
MRRIFFTLLLATLPLAATLMLPPTGSRDRAEAALQRSSSAGGAPVIRTLAERIDEGRRTAETLDIATANLSTATALARETMVFVSAAESVDSVARRAMLFDCEKAASDAHLLLEARRAPNEQVRLHDVMAVCADRSTHEGALVALSHVDRARAVLSEEPHEPGLRIEPWRALWASEAALTLGEADRVREEAEAAGPGAPTLRLELAFELLAIRASLRLDDHAASAIRDAEAFLHRFPETPAADTLILEVVDAEMSLGRNDAAMRRAHRFLLERPQIPIAAQFDARVRELEGRGVRRPATSWEQRFEQAREVRFSRFRDHAELLLEVLEEEALAGGRVADANRVRFQRILNAWEGGRSEDGLAHVEAIRASGFSGVSERSVRNYKVRFLGRLGRTDEGILAIRRQTDRRPRSEQLARLAEYGFMVGRYEIALEAAEEVRGSQWFSTFDGAFLLYLAGEYARARNGFRTIAERSTGAQQRRARYWQGRAETRRGDRDAAISVFAALASEDPFDYHSRVARSRYEELAHTRPRPSAPPVEHPVPSSPGDGGPAAGGSAHHDASFASVEIHPEGHAATSAGEPVPVQRPARRIAPQDSEPMGFRRLLDPETGDEGPVLQRIREFASGPQGAVRHFAHRWGDLFPDSRTTDALIDVGAREEARVLFRDVAEEFRGLAVAGRRRSLPLTQPIELSAVVGAHRIDNRRQPAGWWGLALNGSPRWPIPESDEARQTLMRRQTAILTAQDDIRADIRAALQELGDAHLVRRFALEEGGLHGEPPGSGNLHRWRAAYPPAFAETMLREARRHDLCPFLLWALMVVESDLNPDSISRADAYGLMQVIPRTGHLTADRRGTIGFGIHSLIDPVASIEAGTWYFSQLMEKFSHQETLALVSYNAGPHQMARWMDWRGSDLELDALLETIPFDRARRYAERILRLAWLYRAIWEEDGDESHGNTLDVSYGDNIDW